MKTTKGKSKWSRPLAARDEHSRAGDCRGMSVTLRREHGIVQDRRDRYLPHFRFQIRTGPLPN